MNPELQKVLAELAAKLGVTVDHLWSVLLYQAKIEAAFDLLIFLLCMAYFVGGGWLLRRSYFRSVEDGVEDGWWFILTMFVLAGFFVLTVTLMAAHGFISAGINPEYWALKQIIGGE